MNAPEITKTATPKAPVSKPVWFIGQCERCKKVHRLNGVQTTTGSFLAGTNKATIRIGEALAVLWNGRWQHSIECCKGSVLLRKIVVTGSKEKCDARCTSAKGTCAPASVAGRTTVARPSRRT